MRGHLATHIPSVLVAIAHLAGSSAVPVHRPEVRFFDSSNLPTYQELKVDTSLEVTSFNSGYWDFSHVDVLVGTKDEILSGGGCAVVAMYAMDGRVKA